jgi:hypothetical protein
MQYEVEVTDEYIEWWNSLSEEMQEDIRAVIKYLEEFGPSMSSKRCKIIKSSRHRGTMRELIVSSVQSADIRIFFAFDPRRMAILLIGGDKFGQWETFYPEYVRMADDLYDEHLRTLQREGLLPVKRPETKRKR